MDDVFQVILTNSLGDCCCNLKTAYQVKCVCKYQFIDTFLKNVSVNFKNASVNIKDIRKSSCGKSIMLSQYHKMNSGILGRKMHGFRDFCWELRGESENYRFQIQPKVYSFAEN